MTATSPAIAHLHAAPVHEGLRFSSGRHPFAVVLALVLWGLLSSTSHASTCASRTVKTESAPAASYEVDATPIEEVITSHKASVVWTGCPPGAPASGGEWLAYFSSNFGTTWAGYATNWGAPYYWNWERDSPTETPFAVNIRFLYNINCAVNPRTYCLDSKDNPVVTTLISNSNHDSGLQMFVDVRFSARDNNKKGCLSIGGGKEATWNVEGTTGSTVRGKAMPVHLINCTSLRMDLTLTIIKTKPFSIPGTDDVATINLTRNNNFKYSLCSVGKNCTAVPMLGAPFSVFDSGKRLTINLTKTVRPLPPTRKCVVQLQSAPSRSRL